MNRKISDKDKKDWKDFVSSKEKLPNKDLSLTKKKIVKIGNGDMKLAKKIINLLNLRYCSDFELEFVDESKTSVKVKNYNQRGKRDMLSAKYISRREGPRHLVLPLSRIG